MRFRTRCERVHLESIGMEQIRFQFVKGAPERSGISSRVDTGEGEASH